MNYFDLDKLRLYNLQKKYLEIPEWAKKEKYEYVIAESKLWRINQLYWSKKQRTSKKIKL